MDKSVAFAVLAGGKSSRMGQNKALLPVEGVAMLERILSFGSAFTEKYLSVDSEERYRNVGIELPKDLNIVVDEVQGYGPLEGIYRLLSVCTADYVLCAATDMPYISEEFLRRWAKEADGACDCYVLTLSDGHPEPLLSIYGKGCIPELEAMRLAEEHKPRILFDRVKTRYVSVSELGFSDDLLKNVNTPEDYAALSLGKQ